MKKTAYIHIGMPKTGTTAIQSTLQRFFNEGKLDKYNMQFHHNDTWKLLTDIQSIGAGDEKYAVEQIHKLISRFSKIGEKNVIISNEGLVTTRSNGYWGFSYKMLPLFATALQDYNVKVIIYLRRQDLFIESYINQYVKMAVNTSFKDSGYYYKELIYRCIEAFGRGGVIVRKYERERLYENDAVADFLHLVGLDDLIDDYRKHKGKTINSSLSARSLKIAMVDNKQYMFSEAETKQKIEYIKNQYNDGLISKEECIASISRVYNGRLPHKLRLTREKLLTENLGYSLDSGTPGFLSAEERADMLSKYAEDNAAVAREFFDSEDGVLFNDKVPANIVDINSDPSTTDIVQTFMPILIDLSQRLDRLDKIYIKLIMPFVSLYEKIFRSRR